MNQGLIPKRYAKALYEVAAERGVQKQLYEYMCDLYAAFMAEPKLAETMENPFVSDDDKVALIYTASQSDSSDQMMADLVRLLRENHRMGLAKHIALAYQDIYRQANNIYRVHVTSAAPLSAVDEERLKKLIVKHLNGGTMEYEMTVDPDLIGGFVVNIDNQRLDASVKNELKQLRLKLLSNK